MKKILEKMGLNKIVGRAAVLRGQTDAQQRVPTILLTALSFVMFTALAAQADENMAVVRYNASPTNSLVTMDGTSTIHDWTVTSPLIGGYMEVAEGFPEAALNNPAALKPDVHVIIPVRSLKSYATRMDEVMQEHLKMDQFSKIEYRVIELKPKSPAGTTGKVEFEATGALTVSGVTKTNVMPVTIEHVDGDKLKVTGSTKLKMTDFNVEPPAPKILGMPIIKTGDEIAIKFEWVVAPKK